MIVRYYNWYVFQSETTGSGAVRPNGKAQNTVAPVQIDGTPETPPRGGTVRYYNDNAASETGKTRIMFAIPTGVGGLCRVDTTDRGRTAHYGRTDDANVRSQMAPYI